MYILPIFPIEYADWSFYEKKKARRCCECELRLLQESQPKGLTSVVQKLGICASGKKNKKYRRHHQKKNVPVCSFEKAISLTKSQPKYSRRGNRPRAKMGCRRCCDDHWRRSRRAHVNPPVVPQGSVWQEDCVGQPGVRHHVASPGIPTHDAAGAADAHAGAHQREVG